MKLKNKYVIGCHVMFYEVEMFKEYIESCIQMSNNIDNKENLLFHFTFNVSEYFEEIDRPKIDIDGLKRKFHKQIDLLVKKNIPTEVEYKTNKNPIYNIPAYRRDLNYNYCLDYDFILGGETDSLGPSNTFGIIEKINEHARNNLDVNRFIINFGYRKMGDESGKPTEHLEFKDEKFSDSKDGQQNNPASPKSYMSLDQMKKLNGQYSDNINLDILARPKFDGSCLVISSELIKSGVNIPHSLLMCGEDESFARIAYRILGNNYTQFSVRSVLRVHNRRHPKKRMYIKNENNIKGYCDKKGKWWNEIEKMSKNNLAKLFNNQDRFFTYNDGKEKIKEE